MRTLGKCAACKLLPKYRRCHLSHHDPTLVKQISDNMLEILLYLADPAAQQRKQKASRTEEQIKEQLLKRSIDAKEKRKNFTDEERKRESARPVENRRKRKARWNSEERAENRTKEAATEKKRRDGWSDEHREEVLLKAQN